VIRTVSSGYGVHGSEPDVTEGSMLQGPARERSETYETHIRCAVETRLPTPFGAWPVHARANSEDASECPSGLLHPSEATYA
jgi:hypothetical protein